MSQRLSRVTAFAFFTVLAAMFSPSSGIATEVVFSNLGWRLVQQL
jgi:hypothetical protein